MSDSVEKVYCYDRPQSNDGLLTALAMQKNETDPTALASMMANGGMNNWMNNPLN